MTDQRISDLLQHAERELNDADGATRLPRVSLLLDEAVSVLREVRHYRATLAATEGAPLPTERLVEALREMQSRFDGTANPPLRDHDLDRWTSHLSEAHGVIVSLAAQLAAVRAERDALRERVDGVASVMTALAEQRCSDGFCELGGQAKGMHTNGGCHCLTDVRPFLLRKGLLKLMRECRALATPARPTDATPTPLPYPEDTGRTHYDGCWRERGHHNCAVARADTLAAQLAATRVNLRTVSEEAAGFYNDALVADERRKKAEAERDALRERMQLADRALADIEGHHMHLNAQRDRDENRSHTLRWAREARGYLATPARPTDTGRDG